jgi:hypothetical protein
MKIEHTPGPWEAIRDAVPAGFTQFTVYAEGSGRRVATAFEADANAQLIAAAPELLAALIALDHDIDCYDGSTTEKWQSVKNARAAIAKATQ